MAKSKKHRKHGKHGHGRPHDHGGSRHKSKKHVDNKPPMEYSSGSGTPRVIVNSSAEHAAARRLPGIEIVDYVYKRRDLASSLQIKQDFKDEKAAWLKEMARLNEAVLLANGFRRGDIVKMTKGLMPDNYSCHHIKPKDDGGDNSWDNFVLIKRSPQHDAVHQFLDPQIAEMKRGESRIVRFPDIQPGVYPPVPGLKLPDRSAAPASTFSHMADRTPPEAEDTHTTDDQAPRQRRVAGGPTNRR